MDNKLYHDFLDDLDYEDQIRLKYCTQPHAGAWITAPPLPCFGLSLDHFNFQTTCKWWLGLNQPLAAEKCSICYVNTTPKATHSLACKHGGYNQTTQQASKLYTVDQTQYWKRKTFWVTVIVVKDQPMYFYQVGV